MSTPKSIKQAKERITASIARRQGQPQFRQSLLEVYNYRCAITGCDAQEALEAAHIIPYSETENNHPSNGFLLRADIHTLFDLNLIAINPETMQVNLAPSLHHTSYREIDGMSLRSPKITAYFPKKEALQWRCKQCEWYKQE
jgi:predicted restriction endonuclease